MKHLVYTKVLNFLFKLIAGGDPLKGPVITTERLKIIIDLFETFNSEKDGNGYKRVVKRIEYLVLEYLLKREIFRKKVWSSIRHYALYLESENVLYHSEGMKLINTFALELYFNHFLGVEYVGCYAQNILRITIGIFRAYLLDGDYHYRKNRKKYPVDLEIAEKLLKQITIVKERYSLRSLDPEMEELGMLLNLRKEEFEKKKEEGE